MNFSYYDLGHRNKGEIVEVKLTAAANVRLMDFSNYNNYMLNKVHIELQFQLLVIGMSLLI